MDSFYSFNVSNKTDSANSRNFRNLLAIFISHTKSFEFRVNDYLVLIIGKNTVKNRTVSDAREYRAYFIMTSY